MGMRRNDLPFELRFYLYRNVEASRDCFLTIMDDFVEEPSEVDSSYVQMREFAQVEVELVAKEPGPWRLYLAGLERSDSRYVESDGKESWLPHGARITLSSPTEEPWIPGYYDVQVRCGDRIYYNLLYVCPKGMTTHQLDLMRQEIEDLAAGLAMDVAGGRAGGLSPEAHYRYRLLWDNFPQLCAAVTDILERPSQQVTRNWQVVPSSCARRIDRQSITWLSKHPQTFAGGKPQRILWGKGTVLYDLPENVWLAGVLDQIITLLGEIALAGEGEQAKRALHMQERLRILRQRPPLAELIGGSVSWSLAMFKDGRYRLLYELWRQLFKPLSVYFRGELGWKRTDKLFEYWCFLRTIVALEELGFSPTGGTLLAGQLEKEGVVVSLSAGTKVELSRGERSVVVTYDEVLPHTLEEVRARDHFLMVISPHDKPDIRLDFYENGAYQYTSIMDAKYRHPLWIWDRRVFAGGIKWPQAMNQISNYKNSVYNINQSDLRCVREAALICPPVEEPQVDYASDYHLALVMEAPGDGKVLREYLESKVIA